MKIIYSKLLSKALFILCIVLIGVFFTVIISNSNWIMSDHAFFINAIESGTPFALSSVNPHEIGRFTPLIFTEYMTVFWTGDSPQCYYLVQAIKWIVFSLLMFLTFRYIRNNYILDVGNLLKRHKLNQQDTINIVGLIILIGLLLLLPISTIFIDLVYFESMQIIWQVLFIYFMFIGIKRNSSSHLCLSLLFANIMIYYKEPAFTIILTISVVNLLLSYKNLSRKIRVFYFLLGGSALLWILLYYLIVYRRISSSTYGSVRIANMTIFTSFFYYFVKQFSLYFVFLIGGVYIFIQTISSKFIKKKHLNTDKVLVDSILYSGIVYILCYVALKLNSNYYSAPGAVQLFISAFYYVGMYVIQRERITIKWLINKPIILLLIVWVGLAYFANSNIKRTIRNTFEVTKMSNGHIPAIKILMELNKENRYYFYVYPPEETENKFFDVALNYQYQSFQNFYNFYNQGNKIYQYINTEGRSDNRYYSCCATTSFVPNDCERFVFLAPKKRKISDEKIKEMFGNNKIYELKTEHLGLQTKYYVSEKIYNDILLNKRYKDFFKINVTCPRNSE